jgi:hypothetical protein
VIIVHKVYLRVIHWNVPTGVSISGTCAPRWYQLLRSVRSKFEQADRKYRPNIPLNGLVERKTVVPVPLFVDGGKCKILIPPFVRVSHNCKYIVPTSLANASPRELLAAGILPVPV